MPNITRSILSPYSAEQMFHLVNDVPSYASFLPHCSGSRILEQGDGYVVAEIDLKMSGIKKSFATKNVNTPNSKITMEFVKGPFKYLDGAWTFEQMGDQGAKVTFQLNYEFSIAYLDKLIGLQFKRLANNTVNAFADRARKIYG